MSGIESTPRDGHEDIGLLLPWFVNGTLEPEERDRVAAHLASCAACREEAERCARLAAAFQGEADLAPSPHPERVERLLERAAAPADPPARRRRPALAWPLAAVLTAAVGAAWFGWRQAATPAQPFHTLAAPAAMALPARGVRVVFAPATTETTLREILLSVRGRIVGGPTPLGVYTVELPAGPDADPLGVVVEHLRSRPEIRFAEPLGSSP